MRNRIAELREARGLSQRRLGELMDTTGQQIGHLESGKRKLNTHWMERLSAALRCHPSELLAAVDTEWFTSRIKGLGKSFGDIAQAIGTDTPMAVKILSGLVEFRLAYAEPLARILEVPAAEVLRRAGIGGLSDGSDAYADPSTDPAAAEKARRDDFIATFTDDPDLFVGLTAEYRALYGAEGVAITESQLAALVLGDYAELVLEPRESRPMMAKGLVAAQRRWLQANKADITAP